MAEYYKVISGEGIGLVDPDCNGLLDAYKGLVNAKTCEDLKTVIRAVGTSVADGKIGIGPATLLAYLA